jgi:hypothetical protein
MRTGHDNIDVLQSNDFPLSRNLNCFLETINNFIETTNERDQDPEEATQPCNYGERVRLKKESVPLLPRVFFSIQERYIVPLFVMTKLWVSDPDIDARLLLCIFVALVWVSEWKENAQTERKSINTIPTKKTRRNRAPVHGRISNFSREGSIRFSRQCHEPTDWLVWQRIQNRCSVYVDRDQVYRKLLFYVSRAYKHCKRE